MPETIGRTDTGSSARPNRPPRRGGLARGIPLFKVFGIQIRVDWSWLLLFGLAVWGGGQFLQQEVPGQSQPLLWAFSAVMVLSLFACLLAHELGHSLVAIRHGVQMFDITLFIFGGMARMRGEPDSPGAEFKIAIAGPAVTVALAAIFWPVWYFLGPGMHPLLEKGFFYLALVNTALLVFNMVPGFPLDGGRVLRAIIWEIRGDLLSATRTAAAVGRVFAWALIALGVFQLGPSRLLGVEPNMIGGIFYIFLGWFLSNAAKQSVQHIQLRTMLENFTVRDAMTPQVTYVHPDLTLDRLLYEGFYRYHYKAFPVAREDRVYLGLVTVPDLQGVDPNQFAQVRVSEVAAAPAQTLTMAPDDGLYQAFRRMGEEGAGRVIVLDAAGHIVGLLSRRDIMNLMQVHNELGPWQRIGHGRPHAPGPSAQPQPPRPRRAVRITEQDASRQSPPAQHEAPSGDLDVPSGKPIGSDETNA